ncbi:MAG TPA: pilus assembly protein PilP [Thermodesulfobacteriota bacterium]|nr:pilus assembly protein PilP [Thermodesulfobacteriota bacterium]
MTGLIRLFLVSLIIFSPLRMISAQEAEAPADSTLSQGLQVIKDARENKLETPEERAEKAVGEESPGAAPEPAEEAADTTSPSQPGKVEPITAGEEKLPYDSTGMRDPFKPFIKLVDTPSSPSVVLRPPIQRYPLNQFRIVGIVWIGGKPQAMIVDPEANTYFLGVGDKIGSSDGEILEVRQNGILVQERTKMENVYGEVKIEVKQSVLAFQNDE